MTNPMYTHSSGTPVTQTRGVSSTMRAEFDLIEDGFDLAAPLASPALTGTPTAPTASGGTSTTQIATTAFVTTADALKANIASPTFTGTPAAPTASPGNNSTQIATTAYVDAGDALSASLASPAFTGTPTAPTAAGGTNTTQIATTAFVTAAGFSSALPGQSGNAGKYITTDGTTASWGALPAYALLASPTFTGTPAAPTAAGGTNSTQIATTEFVTANFAGLAGPTFTGDPKAPTPSPGDNDTSIATTAFVATSFAPLASPTLTGTPAAPTAAVGTDTTQIATTAFAFAVSGKYVADAIGTYVFARSNSQLVAFGATIAGSVIAPTSILYGGSGNNNSTGLSGTWRCMGYLNNSVGECTLFLRIS